MTSALYIRLKLYLNNSSIKHDFEGTILKILYVQEVVNPVYIVTYYMKTGHYCLDTQYESFQLPVCNIHKKIHIIARPCHDTDYVIYLKEVWQ